MSTISANKIVRVTPSVLAAGGSSIDMIGLMLTTDTRVPIGTVQPFGGATELNSFFGAADARAVKGGIYFNGFDNSQNKPGRLLVAQYPRSAVSAYLRGANVSSLTLAQLQALNGFLGVVIDGVLKSATINLAGATSFSNAASIIGNSLGIAGISVGSVTGSIAGGTLTATAVTGTLGAGNVISGTGVVANTYVLGQLSGTTGGVGTYSVSPSQTALSQAITVFAPGASYDSVSGAFIIGSGSTGSGSTIAYGSGALATSLSLTQALGAVLSQGAGAATPGPFMDAIILQTQNWATFFPLFDTDPGGGETVKLAFSAWASAQNNRFGFIAWDDSVLPATQNPSPTSFGAQVTAAGYAGTMPVWGIDGTFAAFISGAIASIGFGQAGQRATLAFRSQAGLVANVSDDTTDTNLTANGYNFYGVTGAASENFTFLKNGFVSGPFRWIDSFVDQIWMNTGFQVDLLTMLTQVLSIPYNAAGKAIIEAALADRIQSAKDFGAIRAGVTLSASQRSAVNSAAGLDVATTIENQGYYLLVGNTIPTTRVARGSPPCTFWYADGQSVQQINLASIELE